MSTRAPFQFRDCSVDVATRELRRDGFLVSLSPKVFDCIAYLIEHRIRAVGRDELVSAVWGRTDVSDAVLGQVVVKARKAIGDIADEKFAIRTIPRFGYRWVAPIDSAVVGTAPIDGPAHEATIGAAPLPAAATATVREPPSPHTAWRVPLLALLVFVAIGLAVGTARREVSPAEDPTGASPAAAMSTVLDAAVLPVAMDRGLDADDSLQWVRLGVMDVIAGRLRHGGLSVAPSETIAALARPEATAVTFRRIADAVHPRNVVAPTAHREQGAWRVRLTVQTHDARSLVCEASDTDVLVAATEASDKLLALLGRSSVDAATATASMGAFMSKVRAALLVDDRSGVHRLIESARPELRDALDAQLALAEVDTRSGDFAAADRILRNLLAENGGEATPLAKARILIGLGNLAIRLDKASDAARLFGDALALLDTVDAPLELGRAYGGLAVARALQGALDQAADDFGKARIAYEAAGDAVSVARIESNEGLLAIRRNRQAEALLIFARVEQRYQHMDLPSESTMIHSEQINANLALLRTSEAMQIAGRTAPAASSTGGPLEQDLAYQQARALAAAGRLTEARAILAQLIASTPRDRSPTPWATFTAEMAQVEWKAGNVQAAARAAGAAAPSLDGADDARESAAAWLVLIRAQRAAGDREAAERSQRDLASAAGRGGPLELASTLVEAEVAAADGRLADATPAYERALQQANATGVPSDIADVVRSYGGVLIDAGNLDRASAVIGQVARWSDDDFGCAVMQARLFRALGRSESWTAAVATARRLAGERTLGGVDQPAVAVR